MENEEQKNQESQARAVAGVTLPDYFAIPAAKRPNPVTAPAWFEVEVPAGTPEDSPFTLDVTLPFPKIGKVQVLIPPGHLGLARLSMEVPGGRLIPGPTSNVRWIRGDSFVYDSPLNYQLDGPPYKITFKAWNADATYSHTFFVSVYP